MHASYCLAVASSLSLDVEYLFGRFPSFFVDGCSALSCGFGVFVRGGELKSFSAILSPTSYSHIRIKDLYLKISKFQSIS